MILAVDTATRWIGLGLHDGTAVVAESGWRAHKTQTIALAPAVATMLDRAGIEPADLTGVAVAVGPGSYTGLRVGLGFAKGLALANKIPLVGVPTMDIVAASLAGMTGQLIIVAEAGRSRITAAFYKWHRGKGWQKTGRPVIESWEGLLAGLEGPTSFAGEITPEAGRLIKNASKEFRQVPAAASVRRAGYLAEIGYLRVRKSRVDDPATLAPVYLREPAGS